LHQAAGRSIPAVTVIQKYQREIPVVMMATFEMIEAPMKSPIKFFPSAHKKIC
jgi:hypothetical protein